MATTTTQFSGKFGPVTIIRNGSTVTVTGKCNEPSCGGRVAETTVRVKPVGMDWLMTLDIQGQGRTATLPEGPMLQRLTHGVTARWGAEVGKAAKGAVLALGRAK